MKRSLAGLAVLAVLGTMGLTKLQAQSDRGTITGVISDTTGRVIPGATLQLTNEATGIQSTTVSGESGNYNFPSLTIGSYTISASQPGFKTYVRNAVQVQTGQTTRVDARLEVGQVEERVTVTADAPLLNTETSDVGIVVNSQQFLDLPLTLGGAIRNPSTFIFLAPGVSGDTWEKHIAGGSSFSDAVYYDGVALSVAPYNDAQYNPSVDAIAEFKLITNDYSAEYGHALAGVTSYTLKSGTNEFHGSLFEFFRNEKLDARGFFATVKPPTRQNEFGGTFGGPIVKNNTFFFVSVDSFRRRQGANQAITTVPMPEFLRGDFSALSTPIYDPETTVPDGSGGFTRTQFPGNMIPQEKISPVSAAIAALLPPPNIAGRLTSNYLAPLVSPLQDVHNWTAKVDHQITSYHKIFGTFIFTNRPAIKGFEPGVEGPAEDHNRQELNSRLLRIGHDWTASPTVLNHFAASIDRVVDTNRSLSYGQGWPGRLGLTGVQGDLFPSVTFTQGYARLGDSAAYVGAMTTYGVLDTLNWTRGKHSLKMGAEFMRHQDNYNDEGNTAGTFRFNRLETGLPGVTNTGNAVASFLLGQVNSASSQFHTTSLGARFSYFGAFIQDDFKVTPKLTLNLGLRWEMQTPFSDPLDRLSYMDPTLPNPGAAGLPGAYTFAGSNGGGWERIGDTKYTNFGPRIGAAYSFAENWVARAGYGIFYLNQGTFFWIPTADGFNTFASFASGNAGVTPAFNWTNGFPQNFQHPPIISPTVQNGQNATMVLRSRGGVWPYTQQWNATIERQLGPTAAIRASYVGIKGTRLLSTYLSSLNQVHPNNLQLGDLLNAAVDSPDARAAGLVAPFPGFVDLWGEQATVAQALRPFPQYGDIYEFNDSYGNSIYNSLQLYFQKRMARNLNITTAYTFSKAIDDTSQLSSGVSLQNYYDRRGERSISGGDQPHVVSLSYVYQLPLGPGQRWLSGPGATAKILGGWTVSGIHRYGSGLPLAVTTANTLPIFNANLRPNVVAGVDQSTSVAGTGDFDPGRDVWVNRDAFRDPEPYTFGSASRYLSSLRGPGLISEAFAVIKNTAITERVNLQFRTEITNPLNRVTWSNPITDFSAENFGQIVSQSNPPRNIQLGLKLLF